MASPTQQALKELRRLGYTVAIVEHWNPFAKIRQDLFGFIDLLAIKKGEILGVQVTSGEHHSNRATKSKNHKNYPLWVASGGRFEVWSFKLGGARGKRKVWTLRREDLSQSNTIKEQERWHKAGYEDGVRDEREKWLSKS